MSQSSEVIQTPPIEITVGSYLNSPDFADMLAYSVPFADGKKWFRDGRGTHFRISPLFYDKATRLLKRYGIRLSVVDKVEAESEVLKGKKKRMPLEIFLSVERKLVLVKDQTTVHEIPFDNVDMVLKIIREKKELTPRALWTELALRHNLFPELFETIGSIRRDKEISRERQGDLTTFLYKAIPDMFEGMRKQSKHGSRTYYNIGWFPILVLKSIEMIGQVEPNRNYYLKPLGDGDRSWLDFAQRTLEATDV